MSQILDELDITNAHSFYDFIDRHNGFLINFLSYFLQDKDDISSSFDTIINSAFKNHDKLKLKENQSLFLLRGCLKIALSNPDTQDKLDHIKESLYEVGEVTPLQEQLFDETEYDLISYHKLMTEQLSPLQFFLLQLLCIEQFKINDLANLLNVSAPILEAYLFQLCMGLCNIDHTTIDENYDIVETFATYIATPLHQIQLDSNSTFYNHEYRLKKILQLCSINRYNPLPEKKVLKVVKQFFPHFELQNIESNHSENSIIDQIRQQNEENELEKYSQVQMSEEDIVQEYDVKHSTPQVNEKAYLYSKFAAGILIFFVFYTGYQSFQTTEKVLDTSTLTTKSSKSLQEIQQSTVIGSLNFDGEGETPFSAGESIQTKDQEAELILNNKTSIVIHEYSKLIVSDSTNIFLHQGDIEVSTPKNNLLTIQTKHGVTQSSHSKSRVAKIDRNYSLAANFSGSLNVLYNKIKNNVAENEQIIFGLAEKAQSQSYDTASFSISAIRKNKSKTKNSFRARQKSFNQLTRNEKQDKVILIKQYMKKPQKKHLEFLQKL
ncbi:MAG: hypothetical protein KC646_16525 [Candidatus Cloacimonetes bacterium]|nr:hypothetical protein [Candidatus Cloacimonadota bacterium]